MSAFKGWGWRGPGPPLGVPFEMNTQSPQAQGILAWWPTLGSAGANVLRDFGGRGLNGAFKAAGEPAWGINSQIGPILNFDGDDDQIYIGNTGRGLTPFTISVWAKRNTIIDPYGTLFGLTSPYADSLWVYNAGVVGVGNPVGFEFALTGAVWTDNKVHHIALSVPVIGSITSTFHLFFDGAEIAHGGAKFYGTMDKVRLGELPTLFGRYFAGAIGDSRINNISLSAAEVWQQYDLPTRWDLYRPLLRRLWAVPSGGFGEGIFQRPLLPPFRGLFG